MAEKEERILVLKATEDDFIYKHFNGNGFVPRAEVAERMAKAIWEIGHNKVLNISFDELKTKSHKSKSTTFGNFYKLTVERAEAALNALLEEAK